MNTSTKDILKLIRETNPNDLFPGLNVRSVGWGPKIKNGVETGEYALIAYVDEKIPSSALTLEQTIPSVFTLQDVTYVTDVQVPLLYQHLEGWSKTQRKNENTWVALQPKKNETYSINKQNNTVQSNETFAAYGDCHVISDTVEPVKSNRIRRRVLKAGCESIGGVNTWGSYVGTLGTFVLDKSDRQVVALSNNHVFAGSQLGAGITTTSFTNTSTLSAYQPSGFWKTNIENDYIGTCKRPVVIGNKNRTVTNGTVIADTSCDASIVSLKDKQIINNTSFLPIGFTDIQNFKGNFATDEEIDSLLDSSSNNFGAPLFRSGRTCGPIGAPGSTTTCTLSVYQFSSAQVGSYNGYSSYFSNSFFFRGTTVPGRGGDSGTMVLALFNRGTAQEEWKIIGLLFAGPGDSYPTHTIGCRITNISKDLGVIPWNGQSITDTPSMTTLLELNSVQSNNYSATVSLSGRTFYQLGKKTV
jgi:hypothetical protein